MAQPIRMHQIRRVLELFLEGRPIREIARLAGLSRNTAREYLRRAQSCGMDMLVLLQLDDAALSAQVYVDTLEKKMPGRASDGRYRSFEIYLERCTSELGKRGVTRQLLWEEYRQAEPGGYGYTQFCEYLKRYLQRDQAVMHFTHCPAEQLQIDFAGDKLGYVDTVSGEWIPCPVLICVLPFSHYVYAQALTTERQDEFIPGLVRGLEYIEGVPQSIKCDNMRVAVVRSNRYEPDFTEAMEFLAAHYGTTILTARVGKPRDKPSVEKAVDLAYKRLYAPLRHEVFHSLAELNQAIVRQLVLLNTRPFQSRTGSRKTVFESAEKDLLRPLPKTRFIIRHVTYGKVQRNYHVIVGEDAHQYSVPFQLIGKRLKIIYTSDLVEIYDGLKRVASHTRSYRRNGYTTLAEHRPVSHQHMIEQRGWDREYFLRQAAAIGSSTTIVISKILSSKIFYEQTYNSCLGILRLAGRYTKERVEAACKRAENAPRVNYGIIESILKNHLDQSRSENEISFNSPPSHDQIRGPENYQ